MRASLRTGTKDWPRLPVRGRRELKALQSADLAEKFIDMSTTRAYKRPIRFLILDNAQPENCIGLISQFFSSYPNAGAGERARVGVAAVPSQHVPILPTPTR